MTVTQMGVGTGRVKTKKKAYHGLTGKDYTQQFG